MNQANPSPKRLEDLADLLGKEVGVSPWYRVTQACINDFADATGDHQFVHVDEEAAKARSPFGGTIAHGFLTLSRLVWMMEGAMPHLVGLGMVVNYGFDKLRFLAPVPSGARIRGRFVLSAFEERKPQEFTATWQVEVEIEGQDKPALAAVWLTRHYEGA